MTEVICNKQNAIDYLKGYCDQIKNGRITNTIYHSIKDIKETLTNKINEDVILINCCTTTELDSRLTNKLRRYINKENTIALVFIGCLVSAYSIKSIKGMFDGCVKPPVMLPEPTSDDHIRIFLCVLHNTEDNSARYDIDFATRLLE